MRLVLALAVAAASGALAPAAMAASISGTVTDAIDHGPIQGIDVCADPSPYTFEGRCAETNAAGGYTIDSLPGASYSVRFSGHRHNLDYVTQFYDGEESFPGDLVAVGAGEARTGIDAELDRGGTIAGTVTDAGTLAPVANFQVCASVSTLTLTAGRCVRTAPDGEYEIHGLPSEEYQVEFVGEGEFNYLTQYWEGSETLGTWDPVPVTVEATTSGIDAALNRGVEISGAVREAGTQRLLPDITVSLLDPATEELLKWVETDSSGHYAFRGRPGGGYVVAFSRPRWEFDGDLFSTQFYKGATSFAAATPLSVAPPQVLTGIDGEVVYLGPRRETIQVTLTEVAPPPVKPRRCRKGFRKRKVKGKVRCVKVQKRKHRKRHRKGRR